MVEFTLIALGILKVIWSECLYS